MTSAEGSGRVLWVTGGSGFLPSHVCRTFADKGWTVGAIGRRPWESPERFGVTAWVESAVSEAGLARLFRLAGRPTAVFHGAGTSTVRDALSDPQNAAKDTVASTSELIAFLAREAPKTILLYPSSCAVYGTTAPLPTPETAPAIPGSTYGRHKWEAELLCREAGSSSGLRVGVIRYFSLYGPGLRKQLLWDLSQKALSARDGSTIYLDGTGEETRDFMHVEDAAGLVSHCCNALNRVGAGEEVLTINGGTGRSISIAQTAALMLDALRLPVSVKFTGKTRPEDPRHYQADMQRARHLGFSPTWHFEDGVAQVARWVRSIHAPGTNI